VQLSNVFVTSNASGYYYVQEADGQAGIRVTSGVALTPGNSVYLAGTMTTTNSERVIAATGAITMSTGNTTEPRLMLTRTLGGDQFGLQVGVKERVDGQTVTASGLNNIGLLVTVSGRVKSAGSDYFYVDDGCACDDRSGTGVRVLSGTLTEPAVNGYVLVTGISTMHYLQAGPWRALLPLSQADIQLR
jgi:hypothetical protein